MTGARLSPLTVAATTLAVGMWLVLPAIVTAVAVALVWTPWAVLWVVLGVMVVVGLTALFSWLRWRATTYEVTPERFVLRTGILKRSTRTFARNRIRAIDLSAGPVHRILSLAAVHIGTAEQTGDDGSAVLTPLTRDDALRLQAELLPPADARTDTLARFEPGWLRYAPLSWVPLIIAAVIYGIVAQFAEGFGQFAWRWATDTAATVGWWAIISLVLGIPLLIGVAGAILLHTELWWNHRLERTSGVLQVRRGLLTTRTVSLPEERLRGIRIAEPLGIRLAGAAQVEALAIGLKNQGSKDESGDLSQSNVLLPYAPHHIADATAAAVLQTAEPMTAPDGLTAHPQAALRRRLARIPWVVAGWLVVTGTACVLWLPGWWWAVALGAALLAGIGTWLAWDLWRSLGHRLSDQYLVTRSGSLHRVTDALECDAIIGWNVRQSWFQRRRGLLTLESTTGAGSGGCVVLDVASTEGIALADAATPGLLSPFLDVPS